MSRNIPVALYSVRFGGLGEKWHAFECLEGSWPHPPVPVSIWDQGGTYPPIVDHGGSDGNSHLD